MSMSKVVQFDRFECGRVRAELQKALSEVGNKFGLNILLGSGSFCSDSFKMKVECRLDGEQLVSLNDQMKTAFDIHAKYFGLKASDFGRSFSGGRGKRWKIVGIKPQSYRCAIICENTNGKKYKLSAEEVKTGLEAEAEAEA